MSIVDTIKQGDTDELWLVATDGTGARIDLTDATVEALYRRGRTTVAATVTGYDRENGRVRVEKSSLPEGPLAWVMHVTKAGVRTTIPTEGTAKLEVEANMEATA
jgi:hypothetical protein